MCSLLHHNVINKTDETASTSVAYVTSSIYVIQSMLDKRTMRPFKEKAFCLMVFQENVVLANYYGK